MKKLFTFIALLAVTLGAAAQTQTFYMWKNGTYSTYSISEVDSITFSLPVSPNAFDLGLPSGTLWADRNIGADSPEDYGDYFAWGETTPKSTYDWSTYKWCNGSYSTLTKYCTSSLYGTVDNKAVLDAADDAATANWGDEWRMPTYDELSELESKCTWTWTTQNSVKGYKVTGPNGNSIFLPAAGFRVDSSLYNVGWDGDYWSSSLYGDDPRRAWYLYFDSNLCGPNFRRHQGRTVRAVVK